MTRNTNVRAHRRVSPKGRPHGVRQHNRNVTGSVGRAITHSNVSVQEIERRSAIHEQYFTSKKRNWLSKEEQKEVTKLMGGPLTNAMRSRLEVHHFTTEKPRRYFAYQKLDKRLITTWTGDKLGDIIHIGPEYRSNMGDKRVPIRVRGINGITYSGTAYVGAGDYARLQQIK